MAAWYGNMGNRRCPATRSNPRLPPEQIALDRQPCRKDKVADLSTRRFLRDCRGDQGPLLTCEDVRDFRGRRHDAGDTLGAVPFSDIWINGRSTDVRWGVFPETSRLLASVYRRPGTDGPATRRACSIRTARTCCTAGDDVRRTPWAMGSKTSCWPVVPDVPCEMLGPGPQLSGDRGQHGDAGRADGWRHDLRTA